MLIHVTTSALPARLASSRQHTADLRHPSHCLYGKLAITQLLTTFAELWERAAIGPIPGGAVVAAGVLFHGGWAVFAFVTLRIEIASRRERRTLIAMG